MTVFLTLAWPIHVLHESEVCAGVEEVGGYGVFEDAEMALVLWDVRMLSVLLWVQSNKRKESFIAFRKSVRIIRTYKKFGILLLTSISGAKSGNVKSQ